MLGERRTLLMMNVRDKHFHKFGTLTLKVKTENFTFCALLGYFKKSESLSSLKSNYANLTLARVIVGLKYLCLLLFRTEASIYSEIRHTRENYNKTSTPEWRRRRANRQKSARPSRRRHRL